MSVACCQREGISNHNVRTFGAITFTYWLRLANFSVYASTLLLPPELQDSLGSGASLSFYSRTSTRKKYAPYPGAPRKLAKIPTLSFKFVSANKIYNFYKLHYAYLIYSVIGYNSLSKIFTETKRK
jgi:hypothetical protein